MALTFDPSTDFETVVDGTEAVTVTALDSYATAVANALRRSVSRTSDSTELATRLVTVWHLSSVQQVAEPDIGGTITDADGNIWEIEAVANETLSNRWRCDCGIEAVTAVLNTIVTIERAIVTKGPHGSAVRNWAVWRKDVRAAILPADVSMDVEGDARLERTTHTVTLAKDLKLTSQNRLVGRDGTVYHILSHQDQEAVGALQTLKCSVTPFPLR